MHQIDPNDIEYVTERFGAENIAGWMPAPVVDGKINPHVSQFLLKNNEVCSVFHVKPIYYQTMSGHWRPMSEIASYHGNRLIDLKDDWDERLDLSYLAWMLKRAELLGGKVTIPSPSLLQPRVPLSMYSKPGNATINFSILTAYPDPDPETTTVDGDMWGYHAGGGVSATTVRNAANCDSGSAFPSQIDSLIRSDWFSNNGFSFDRFVCLFDTSSITSGAVISATTLSLYQKSGGSYHDGDNDGDDWVGITTASPASNTDLVSDDFDQTGGTSPTEQHATSERKDITSLSGTSGYLNWAFNATGISNVSKTGVSKFTAREGHDMLGNDLVQSNGNGNYIQVWAAENTGTSTDPKLVVTYSVTAGDNFMMGANF